MWKFRGKLLKYPRKHLKNSIVLPFYVAPPLLFVGEMACSFQIFNWSDDEDSHLLHKLPNSCANIIWEGPFKIHDCNVHSNEKTLLQVRVISW
jgi:hypothetical protein